MTPQILSPEETAEDRLALLDQRDFIQREAKRLAWDMRRKLSKIRRLAAELEEDREILEQIDTWG